MNAEEDEAPPFKSPSPPLRQPSDSNSPPHLSTNAGDLEAVIVADSTGATTTTMDNKDQTAVLDDVAVADGGEIQLMDDGIAVEVTGNEATDVDLEPAKVEEEEVNLIIGDELEVRDENSIVCNFMVEDEEDVGEQQKLEEVEQEQQQKDDNLMGEEEGDVGEKQQEEEVEQVEEDHEQEQDHNLMGEDEGDVGEQQQEEVKQEQEEEEGEEGEEEEEDEGEEEEEEDDEQGEEEAGADGDIGLEENREAGEEMEVEVAEEQSGGSVSGGKRKRGSGVKNSKPSGKVSSKKKMEDDVCFICFDGGDLVLCDRR